LKSWKRVSKNWKIENGMKGRLFDLMPEISDSVKENLTSIREYETEEACLQAWCEVIENWLADGARRGDTRFMIGSLPNLEYICVEAIKTIELSNCTRFERGLLAGSICEYCYRFLHYWKEHSDVDMTMQVNGHALLSSRGTMGLDIRFDWTPAVCVEPSEKKRKVE